MAYMENQPAFPPELEETIFSLAAQTDWKSAKSFILVAKSIHDWLIPQIYKVAVFNSLQISSGRPKYNSATLKHHGKHVRRILFDTSSITPIGLGDHSPGECLTWCPNVFDVALWIRSTQYDRTLIEQLLGFHLTHLSFSLSSLKAAIAKYPDISPISFPHVTHLELISIPKNVQIRTFKERFPAITHVALAAWIYAPGPLSTEILKVYEDQIQVMAWCNRHTDRRGLVIKPKSPDHMGYNEPRIVVLSDGDSYAPRWYEGAIGGLGIWKMSEEAVALGQFSNRG